MTSNFDRSHSSLGRLVLDGREESDAGEKKARMTTAPASLSSSSTYWRSASPLPPVEPGSPSAARRRRLDAWRSAAADSRGRAKPFHPPPSSLPSVHSAARELLARSRSSVPTVVTTTRTASAGAADTRGRRRLASARSVDQVSPTATHGPLTGAVREAAEARHQVLLLGHCVNQFLHFTSFDPSYLSDPLSGFVLSHSSPKSFGGPFCIENPSYCPGGPAGLAESFLIPAIPLARKTFRRPPFLPPFRRLRSCSGLYLRRRATRL